MTGFSPLPTAEQGNSDQKFKGVSRILGPGWAHLPTLTIGLLGVQIFWSVEMSYASPYLLSLGLTKSNMAIVFIAGPLSGLIMQPLIGVLADNSTSRFGRRRPYMLLGTCICMTAMLLLGFTRPIASIFTGWDNDSNDTLTIWLAVLAIYLIDFSINAVQAVDRALLVDTLPSSSQPQGNAWAARMLGVGSVVGFFVGNMNLPKYFPFLGKSQLQVLSVIVSLLLLAGHSVMAVMVKERVLVARPDVNGKRQGKSFVQELKDIWTNMLTLPRVIRQICIIQFFAWLAWFPTLFYTTIYIGDLHKRVSPTPQDRDAQDALDAESTRLGSRALFYSSLLALAANLVLPAFVSEANRHRKTNGNSHGSTGFIQKDEKWWERLVKIPRGMQVHLASLWAVSHLVFAGCMMATFFTHSVFGATFLVTITGFSWAITQWAPFSLLGEAILTEPGVASHEDAGSIHLADTRTPRRSGEGEQDVFLPGGDDSDSDGEEEEAQMREREERRRVLGNSGAQLSRIDVSSNGDGYEQVGGSGSGSRMDGGGLSAKAGIILGIHNVFVVVPQFLITGLSAIVFAIFDPQKSVLPAHHSGGAAPGAVANSTVLAVGIGNATVADVTGRNVREVVRGMLFHSVRSLRDAEYEVDDQQGQSNSVVYIFRFGGIAALVAFVLSWRLAREIRHR
ncbi:major facilitator superfamily domain-containing protein [Crucibulum laeve]|uniref:Major facilitator superfamily domain-containing protein n=1 Tax=Crucibulum laeve TaxID=68775 RepID=A0A5C3LSL0_9AGAR|nr:major facilitator superfamily domain-containing protein [Crucibulum laeve]